MEIRPTPVGLAQFSEGQNGRLIPVEDDVQNVANDLAAIDPGFRLRFSEAGNYFAVYFKPEHWEEGDGYLVTTAQELDQRVVKLVEAIHWRVLHDASYSYGDEIEKAEEAAKKLESDRFLEEHAEMFAQLGHAMRKDLGVKSRVFIPVGLND